MTRSINTRIDKNLKEFLEEVSDREGISQIEASRELWKEITGHSLFEKNKKEDRVKTRNLFG